MKITNDKTENSQMFLTIEMEPEEVEESMQVAFKRLNKKARIPGFRKGKAPRDIFERYLGKEYLMEEALNDIIPTAYAKAVEEQSIEAIAQTRQGKAQNNSLPFPHVGRNKKFHRAEEEGNGCRSHMCRKLA